MIAVVVLVAVLTVRPVEQNRTARPVGSALRPSDVAAVAARATAALRARDAAAWRAALPAANGAIRRAVDDLYSHVARLPWTSVRLVVEPAHGSRDRYYVGAVGELGGAAPADRIMARQVFELGLRDGRVVLLADVTPRGVRGQQVMAFDEPVTVRKNSLVVIVDRDERSGAEALARAGVAARRRLALLGITSRRPVVVYYYASRRELRRSLGEDPGESRIRFFSHAPIHLGEGSVWARDVGVLGPALAGKESWAPRMLAHELTHVYASRWFANTRHAPTLLAEGLATAVEGGRSFQALRRDLAAHRSAFPLEVALRADSLWRGNPTAKVRLAYLEGASLVLYVKERWGLRRLKRFITAVADSDLRREGLDEASRRTLAVSWGELRSGWIAFVQTLP